MWSFTTQKSVLKTLECQIRDVKHEENIFVPLNPFAVALLAPNPAVNVLAGLFPLLLS